MSNSSEPEADEDPVPRAGGRAEEDWLVIDLSRWLARTALLVGIVGCMAAARPVLGQAPPGNPALSGVDVVFVVDQSGSMGGLRYKSTGHPEANDPNDVRFSGLQQMILRLAGYRANYFHDSQVGFQTAVIYFGGSAEVTLPRTALDLEEGERLPDSLISRLSVENFRRNLNTTDHLKALREARNILKGMESTWKNGSSHLQAILLLTDGESYVACNEPGSAVLPYCEGGGFNVSRYNQDLGDFIREELPYPRYRFFVGAINDRSRSYWTRVEQQWKEWTHENAEQLDTSTMWAFFENALASLTINDPTLGKLMTTPGEVREIKQTEDQVEVQPYLQEIEFIIHKPDPATRVHLDQEGKPLDDGTGDLTRKVTVRDRDQYIESILIRQPAPGIIHIRRPVTTGILRIFFRKLLVDLRCDPIPRIVRQYSDLPIRCAFTKSLPDYHRDPRYRLGITAQIKDSDGNEISSALSSNDDKVYEGVFHAAKSGEHVLTVVASYSSEAERRRIELFRRPSIPFLVRYMKLARPAILRPRPDAKHAWRNVFWWLSPLDVEVAVVDDGRKPLSPGEFLNDPAGIPLVVEMVSPRGEVFPVDLRAATEAGRYEGSFAGYSPFRWYIQDDRGWYELHARPARPDNLKENYTFGEPPIAKARIRLTRNRFWWLLPVAVGLALIALGALWVRNTYRRLWSITGTLTIEGTGVPWLRRLGDYGRHTIAFKRRRDSLPPGLRKVTVHQRRGRHPAVEVKIRFIRGATLRHTLLDGARKALGDGLFLSYERGVGASDVNRASLNLPVVFSALMAVLCFIGLAGVIGIFIQSLA
jgi:von Willebrand factor type A domain